MGLVKTLPKAPLPSNLVWIGGFGLVGLAQEAWVAKFGLVGLVWFGRFGFVGLSILHTSYCI